MKSVRVGRRMYERCKNVDLNKIQRSNERVSQDKESLERHKDSLHNKSFTNSLHSSQDVRTGSMSIDLRRTHCFLEQLTVRIQLTKEKITLKSQVLSR